MNYFNDWKFDEEKLKKFCERYDLELIKTNETFTINIGNNFDIYFNRCKRNLENTGGPLEGMISFETQDVDEISYANHIDEAASLGIVFQMVSEGVVYNPYDIFKENEDGDHFWAEKKHFKTSEEFMEALYEHLLMLDCVSDFEEFEDTWQFDGLKLIGTSPADDGYNSWVDVTDDGIEILPYWCASC